jgi:hypothetical protein
MKDPAKHSLTGLIVALAIMGTGAVISAIGITLQLIARHCG